MADKPSRLGRGLAALIGDMAQNEGKRVAESLNSIKRLPVDFVIANRQNPRRDFDAGQLDELTSSIKEKGVMQPLLVRPTSDPNVFEIIAGERRWRAAQKAGLHEVPVLIREVDDKESLELAIIENVQRVDLNPLEEAQGYGQLMEQFNYTQQDLAQVIGKSRSHVANTLRLLRLPEEIRDMLARGELTAGHARALITSDNPIELARQIIAGKLSVREAETLGQGQSEAATKKRATAAPEKDADTLALEKRLSDLLGLKVLIEHKNLGGSVEIRYKTLEQLDDICGKLRAARPSGRWPGGRRRAGRGAGRSPACRRSFALRLMPGRNAPRRLPKHRHSTGEAVVPPKLFGRSGPAGARSLRGQSCHCQLRPATGGAERSAGSPTRGFAVG